ncbi:MAG: D-glycero-beta-D-manno-heptose-7-phosphate kinase [Gammaproteobacteria bacterium]|nr:D-glycero-beta-D-manno-heptose-7-phosphate kinase [Gammaproteobacteria bacterium]
MESVDHKLDQIADTKVLVVGDVMLDQYWMGDVRRISPEAPVPVIAVRETQERVGGAGNVARNITSLKGSCTLISVVGEDDPGRSIRRIASAEGINAVLVSDPETTTTVKLRVLSRNQQLLRADFENLPGDDACVQVYSRYQDLIEQHDAVVLSDYDKGCLGQIESLIALARQCGKPVLVDPKGTDYSRYRGATMVTPNLSEFEAVAGEVADDRDLTGKAHRLLGKTGIEQLLVTLSDKGMKLFGTGTKPLKTAARSREVYDVSGAGDTVIAVMVMAVSAGLSPVDAMEFANRAAGIVVSKLGTATATRKELRAALLEESVS